MSRFKRLRLLRLRHGISITELSRAAGVSHQYISAIELSSACPSARQKEIIHLAFERVIAARFGLAMTLEAEYASAKDSLFDLINCEKEGAL